MVTYKWGEVEGVSEGQIFARRTDLREAWIHRALVAGIDGNSKVGCSSIVLNGGYVDDFDLGVHRPRRKLGPALFLRGL